jgi:hypothetical protein
MKDLKELCTPLKFCILGAKILKNLVQGIGENRFAFFAKTYSCSTKKCVERNQTEGRKIN